MLGQNKFRKYLLYAIGEIILVVIGILIALQVNNWNEERKLKSQEVTLRKSIQAEFAKNLDLVKKSQERTLYRAELCERLVRAAGPNTTTPSKATTDTLIFSGLLMHVTVELSTSFLDDLINSGKIQLLSNDSLKFKLSDFRTVLTEVREDESMLWDEISTLIKPFVMDHYSYHHVFFEKRTGLSPQFPVDHRQLYKQKKLADLAIGKRRQFALCNAGYGQLEDVIEDILRLAEQETP